MRILFVYPNFSMGGAETHLSVFARELKRRGHTVGIVCASEARLGKHPFDICYEGASLANPSESIDTAVKEFHGIVADFKPEILHTHCIFGLAMTSFLKLEGTRKIHTIHGPFQIGVDIASSCNNVLRFLQSITDEIICVSEETQRLLDNASSFRTCSSLIRNPIEVFDQVPPVKIARSAEESKIILISRLDLDKFEGIRATLVALSRSNKLKHLRLEILGDGEARGLVMSTVFKLGLSSQISMIGAVENIPLWLRTNPYKLVLAMGRAALEAIEAKLPVILVGYRGPEAIIGLDNFEQLSRANFSGRNLITKMNPLEFESSVLAATVQSSVELERLRAFMLSRHGVEPLTDHLEAIYFTKNSLRQASYSLGMMNSFLPTSAIYGKGALGRALAIMLKWKDPQSDLGGLSGLRNRDF